MINDLWYKNAIIYSLDLETFMDGNGDGCGDFEGLTRRLDYLDSLGIDKIIAFGSDVHQTVEKVYGHLEVARRNLALLLGNRVESGLLSEDEALHVAKAWLYDNPKRIYKLVDGND